MHVPLMKSLDRRRPAIIPGKPKVQTGLLVLPVEIRRLVFDHLIGGPGVCIDEDGRCAIGKEVSTIELRVTAASLPATTVMDLPTTRLTCFT